MVIYKPSENYNNDFKILTSVSDGTVIISGERQFTGIAINDTPIASDDLISVTREPSFISAEAVLSNDSDVEDVNALRITSVTSRDESKYVASLVRNNDNVIGIQFEPIDKDLDGKAILDYEIVDDKGLASKGVINLLVGGISIGSQAELIREQAEGVSGNNKTNLVVTLSEGYSLDGGYLNSAGWTTNDQGKTFRKNGKYGTAILNALSGEVNYQLDNSRDATNQLKGTETVFENLGKVKATNKTLNTLSADILIRISGSNDRPTVDISSQSNLITEATFNKPGSTNARIKINGNDLEGQIRIETQALVGG